MTVAGNFICIKDSVFIEPACGNGNFLAKILERKLAVVNAKYRKFPDDWEFSIRYLAECHKDKRDAVRTGIEKLIEYVTNKGHTKLAYIQGNKSSVADKRLAGFCKACISRGINVNNDWLVQGDYHNPDKTYELTKKLLSDKDRRTCIFMPDDYSAIGGYNAIKDLGLSIPEDISVVGYDGINYSQLISPRLTTYSQDTTKIGKIAARQLVALIEDPQTTFTEVITVEGSLVEGDSVAQL